MNVKRMLACCVLALLVTLPAQADTLAHQLATQATLDALFSMSQVQPEGSERVQPPKGFNGDTASEADLIQYLAAQKRQGADLNAYRHLGTPLHHAIRSGLHDTARWLLKNGANPLLRVREDGVQGSYPGPDAWGVSVNVSAWKLLDELRRLPSYKALSADDQARALWPYALDTANKTAMLLSERVALPSFATLPQLADAVLLHSLCTGQPRLAQALLGQPDAPAQPAVVRQPGEPCVGVAVSNDADKPAVPPPPLTEWKAIEERLQWPVLPLIAMRAQSPTQVAQWLASGLRKPWSEPVAATQFVWGAMRAAQPTALALLHAMPTATLQVAMRDPALMTAWLKLVADWPLADLRWALAQVDAGQLVAKLEPVMNDWAYAKAAGREAKDSKDRSVRWALLTNRLVAPLPALSSKGFLYQVPIELWPRWFALGLVVDDAEWASWLAWSDPAPFEQAWPVIAKHQPAIAQRAVEWLVAPLSVGATQDPQTKRLSYGSDTFHYDQSFLRKAKYLLAQRAQTPRSRWLAGARAGTPLEPGVAFALAQNWVSMPPAGLLAQVERAPLNCQARPGAALRRSLASGELLATENESNYEGDVVQLIALPGESTCGWLVAGNASGGRLFFNEESFSGGVQRFSPCPDGSASGVLWNEARSAWMPVTGMPEGGLIPVRLRAGGVEVFASTEVEYGTCGGKSGGVYQPHLAPDGALQLEALGPGHPVFDALALQCDFRALSACLGLTDASGNSANALAEPSLTDKVWGKEKSAFLVAIDRLGRPALNQARTEGIFAGWLDEALQRTSVSPSLTLPDKRKRIAWVFAQRTPRPAFAQDTLDLLVPWLPTEDWGPVLSALRCNRYALDHVAEQALAKNLSALHRRVQAALATPCEAGK